MSILEGYVEGMINLEGGGGGTSDYTDLQNKPSINNVTLEGNKTTEDLNISYDDLQNKPTIRNMPDSSGAAAGDVLTHTSNGDLWLPPVEELPAIASGDIGRILKATSSGAAWEDISTTGYSIDLLWLGVANTPGEITLNADISKYDELEFLIRITDGGAYTPFRISTNTFIAMFPYIDNPSSTTPHFNTCCYSNFYNRLIMGSAINKIYAYDFNYQELIAIRGIKIG